MVFLFPEGPSKSEGLYEEGSMVRRHLARCWTVVDKKVEPGLVS